MATIEMKGKTQDEAIRILAKYDAAFRFLMKGEECGCPHDAFIMGWKRTHADGRVESLSGVKFDDVGVDYLDYLLGALGPVHKGYHCQLWWRIWFYSTFIRKDRWSKAWSKFDAATSPEDRSKDATLGDVMHWRKSRSPDWDDEDYDAAFDPGEELRDRIKRSRYGDVYELSHRAHEGARFLRTGEVRDRGDDDPTVFTTIGLRNEHSSEEDDETIRRRRGLGGGLAEKAKYAAIEGHRGHGEPEDDWTPPLSVRWIVNRNLERRGNKVYRFKKITYLTRFGEVTEPVRYTLFRRNESPLEMKGSEWRPSGDGFIRKDLWDWMLESWNKLRSIAQVMREGRWETLAEGVCPALKAKHAFESVATQIREIERLLHETEVVYRDGEMVEQPMPFDPKFRDVLLVACRTVRKLAFDTVYPKELTGEEVIAAIVRKAVEEVVEHWTLNQKRYPMVGRSFKGTGRPCSERAKEWLRKMYQVQGL